MTTAQVFKMDAFKALDTSRGGVVGRTMAWLRQHFETDAQGTLDKTLMYERYVASVSDAVGIARFVRMVRMDFPQMIVRRLGSRGSTRRRFCGIRCKTPSLQLRSLRATRRRFRRTSSAAEGSNPSSEHAVPRPAPCADSSLHGESRVAAAQEVADEAAAGSSAVRPRLLYAASSPSDLQAFPQVCAQILPSYAYGVGSSPALAHGASEWRSLSSSDVRFENPLDALLAAAMLPVDQGGHAYLGPAAQTTMAGVNCIMPVRGAHVHSSNI
jgi:hypothetical protein